LRVLLASSLNNIWVNRLLRIIFIASLSVICLSSFADVLTPGGVKARDRFNATHIIDRTDQFCNNKKSGDTCSISGNALAGGGDGICERELSDPTDVRNEESYYYIDLLCIRKDEVNINRELTCYNCLIMPPIGSPNDTLPVAKPTPENPSDQYCKDKKIGNPCEVKVIYKNKEELDKGVCMLSDETVGPGYYNHPLTRKVIICDAPNSPRTLIPVPWYKKIIQ
jgi:hypothetical protein